MNTNTQQRIYSLVIFSAALVAAACNDPLPNETGYGADERQVSSDAASIPVAQPVSMPIVEVTPGRYEPRAEVKAKEGRRHAARLAIDAGEGALVSAVRKAEDPHLLPFLPLPATENGGHGRPPEMMSTPL